MPQTIFMRTMLFYSDEGMLILSDRWPRGHNNPNWVHQVSQEYSNVCTKLWSVTHTHTHTHTGSKCNPSSLGYKVKEWYSLQNIFLLPENK